jgi:hypothetical protein
MAADPHTFSALATAGVVGGVTARGRRVETNPSTQASPGYVRDSWLGFRCFCWNAEEDQSRSCWSEGTPVWATSAADTGGQCQRCRRRKTSLVPRTHSRIFMFRIG